MTRGRRLQEAIRMAVKHGRIIDGRLQTRPLDAQERDLPASLGGSRWEEGKISLNVALW